MTLTPEDANGLQSLEDAWPSVLNGTDEPYRPTVCCAWSGLHQRYSVQDGQMVTVRWIDWPNPAERMAAYIRLALACEEWVSLQLEFSHYIAFQPFKEIGLDYFIQEIPEEQVSILKYDGWRRLENEWSEEVRLDQLPVLIEKVRAQLRLAMWPLAEEPGIEIIHRIMAATILGTTRNVILRNDEHTLLVVEPVITDLDLRNWSELVPADWWPTNEPAEFPFP